MSTETISTQATAQIHQLRFARGALKRLLDATPREQFCAQPAPCANHALWIMGHLATTDDYFLKEFGAIESLALNEDWHKKFNMGSTPASDAAQYPTIEEVTRVFEERRAAIVSWFESMSPEELAAPTPEKWRKYAPTIGDVAHFLAWHEGYHAGQLSAWRRVLGLPSVFG